MKYSSEDLAELSDLLTTLVTLGDSLPVILAMLERIAEVLANIGENGPPVLQLLIDIADYGAVAAGKLASEPMASGE
jgi:hypothetical protein